MAFDPAAQLRTSSRAANCSSAMVADACDISGLLSLRARKPCFSLERVLIVPAFDRQVDRHYSRTRRCRRGTEVRKLQIGMRIVSKTPHDEGAVRRMSSPAQTNPSSGGESRPPQVMPVSVLAESELGSEAQRERR